eukprot:TRINITY_DN6422_c0_g1_i1.p1 TRINITY_DN6422_c0_g1~~TRINITY_DN6422_c0_g1_i1.p1  ORF type:complete len:942 (-),score=147.54 TRINITY_DN6422_c0_g1_i1:105-2930(-)
MAASQAATKLPACGFSVSGGKKGNLPVSVEKRPKGKKVTIISNVQGSAKSLLSALSSLLGCGGTLRQETSGVHWTLEIQGDQVERVSSALTQLGCLRGVKKDVETKDKKKTVEDASRVCAYDKFLRRGEPGPKEAKTIVEDFSWVLPGADCTRWHGSWVYCRGRCEQTDLNDVWEGSLRDDEEGALCHVVEPPPPVRSTAELDIILRRMGMLAEVGEAAKTWGRNGSNKSNKGSSVATGSTAAANIGVSLTDYRRSCLAPGAKLIEWDAPGKNSSSSRRAKSRAASRSASTVGIARSRSCGPGGTSSRRAPAASSKPPPKLGCFRCPLCSSVFGLHKTLKLHVRNVHPGQQCPGPGTALFAPPVAPPAVSLMHSRIPGMAGSDRPAFVQQTSPVSQKLQRHKRPSSVAAPVTNRGEHRPASAQTVAKKDRSETNATDKTMVKQAASQSVPMTPCPICSVSFSHDCIDSHVETCLALSNLSEISSDSDEECSSARHSSSKEASNQSEGRHAILIVRESYRPDGPGAATQLQVKKGCRFAVVWQQPDEEGGYWAYGFEENSPWKVGYIPLCHLENLGTPTKARNEQQSPGRPADAQALQGSTVASSQENWILPEEWLETFLLLELSDDQAEQFWDNFGEFKETMSPDAAWLEALSRTCSVKQNRLGKQAEPLQSSKAPSISQSTAYGDSRRQKAPSTQAAKQVSQARSIENTDANARQKLPSTRSHEQSPQASADIRQVVKAWTSSIDGAGIQLDICAGNHFHVEWTQPCEEGGFWAYGHLEGDPGTLGYVPLHCLGALRGATDSAALYESDSMPPARRAWKRREREQTKASANEPCCTEIESYAGKDVLRETLTSESPTLTEACTAEGCALEDQIWAQTKLAALIQRFCLQSLDVAVALSAIAACTSPAEMRREAVALIADNAVVKNFAAELWKRRCSLAAM